MVKFLISALLASTVAVAAPAAAQWAPPVPQGYAYGYNNNHGQARRLEARIDRLRREIRQLDRRNLLSEREAHRLGNEARQLQYRVRQLGYNGLDRRERYEIERQIARLEHRIRREAHDGNRYGHNGYNNGYGDNGYDNRYGRNGYDRDRDGRDDRYENDRGRDHDGRRDRDDD